MAEALQSRRPAASRAEETRTPIQSYLPHVEQASRLFEQADQIDRSKLGRKVTDHDQASRFCRPFQFSVAAAAAQDSAAFDLMQLRPRSAADLQILAGFASMYADQLEDFVTENRHADDIIKGVCKSLIAISAYLAREIGTINTGCNDLDRSIRRDVMLDEIMHGEASA